MGDQVATPTSKAVRRQPIKVEPWARVICAILGVISGGVGGWAVFKTTVEAGPVALLLIGSVFLIAAVVGVLPTTLKWGDKEVQFEGSELAERLEQQGLTTTQKAAVADSLDQAGVPAALTAPIRDSVAVEQSTARLVVDLVERGAGNFTVHPNMGLGQSSSPDLALVRSDGGLVFVDIQPRWPRWMPEVMSAQLRTRFETLSPLNQNFHGLLFLTRDAPTVDFIQTQDYVSQTEALRNRLIMVDMGHQMAGVQLEQALRTLGA